MIDDIRRLPDEAFAATRDLTRQALTDLVLDCLEGVYGARMLTSFIVLHVMNKCDIRLKDIDDESETK